MRRISTDIGVALLAVTLLPASLLAWGASRDVSASGRYGGSFSHESGTAGGAFGAAHYGSSSYTSPTGHTYSSEHAGAGAYGGAWHGAAAGSGPYGGYHARYAGYDGYHAAYGGYGTTYHGATGFGVAYAPPAAGVYVAPSVSVGVGVSTAVPAAAVVTAPPALMVGTTVTTVPVGCATTTVNGVVYYHSGPNWYVTRSTPVGVHFVVVRAP